MSVPEASGRNSVNQSVAPPAGTAAAQREVRLKVTGLEVRLGRSGPDVVSDVSFAVSAFLDSSAFSLAFSSWAFFRIASRTRPSRWR